METNGFAIVTGTSSGIGAALAARLAARGHDVLSIARRPPPAAGSGRIRHLALDLTDRDAIPRVASPKSSPPAGLSTCSSTMPAFSIRTASPIPSTKTAARALRTEIALNLEVPIRLAWSLMNRIARPGGAIVNVTSLTALHPKTSAPVYSATKAGLRSFTRALRLQAAPMVGIHVMEAIPPLVDTAMTSGRGKGKISAEAMADAILAGLADRRRVVAPGLSGKVLRLNRFLPELVARSLARG
jgi:short-subunit dehydrogenase